VDSLLFNYLLCFDMFLMQIGRNYEFWMFFFGFLGMIYLFV
jgi:hypothetical protein